MVYSSDGTQLYVLTADRSLFTISLPSWKRKVLLPPHKRYNMQMAHLALLGEGSKATVVFCQQGSTTVRCLQVSQLVPVKGSKEKPGGQLRTDNKKPIAALAAAPCQKLEVLVLYADGSLSSCTCNPATRTIVTRWCIAVDPARTVLHKGCVQAVACTGLPGTAVIVVGTSNGTIAAYETVGSSDPQQIGKAEAAGAVQSVSIILEPLEVYAAVEDRRSGSRMVVFDVHIGESQASWERQKVVPDSVDDACTFSSRSTADVQQSKILKAAGAWQGLWSAAQGQPGSCAAPGVREVRLHPRLPLAVVQHASSEAFGPATPIGRLPAAAAAAARQLLSLSILSLAHPTAPITIAPSHSQLSFWSGPEIGVSKRLGFPAHICLVEGGQLSAYSLSRGQVHELAPLPTKTSSGQALAAQKVVHSHKKNACLIFFQSSPGGKSDTSGLEFTFVALGTPNKAAWTLHGASGAFAGAEDEVYAVLSNSGLTARVFSSQASASKPSPLRKLDVGAGGAAAFFSGPSWPALPKGGVIPTEGSGIITWASSSGKLCLGELTASRRPDSSYSSAHGSGLEAARTLALLPGETVLQVAWQSLLDEASEGSVSDDSGTGKASIAGAVLTHRRLLLVSATLSVLTAHVPSPTAPAITSFLWLGPALIFCNAAHQVRQLAWTGEVVHVCGLAGGPPSVLAGALADRLLVARGGPSEACKVVPRQIALLPALLLGWASLAACAILPGSWWRARQEMGKLIANYDSSTAGDALLRALVACGASDVAHSLSQSPSASQVSSSAKAASAALEGKWDALVSRALTAHRESHHYPRHPSKDSEEYRQLLGLGRAAAAYGQTTAARQLYEAAGAWSELLSLCALQGDFMSVRDYMQSADKEAVLLGKALLAAAEPSFRAATTISNQRKVAQWNVFPAEQGLRGGFDGEETRAAPAGSVPTMEVTQNSGATGEIIHQMDASLLESYMGLVRDASAGGNVWQMDKDLGADEDDGTFMEASPMEESAADDGEVISFPVGKTASTGAVAGPSLDAQAAARAEFNVEKADAFYSSDEDDAQSSAAASDTGGPKFKVVIKDALPARGGPADTGALRAAAQQLRLSTSTSSFLAPPDTAGQPPRPLRSQTSSDNLSGPPSAQTTPSKLPHQGSFKPPPGLSSPGAQLPLKAAAVPMRMPSPPPSAALQSSSLAQQLPRPSALLSPLPLGAQPQPPMLSPPLSSGQGRGRPMSQASPVAPPMIPDDFFSDPETYTRDAPAPASAPSAAAQPVVQDVPSGTGAGRSEQEESLEEGIRSMEAGSWDRASASFSDALHNSQGDAKNLAAQYLAAVMLCKEAAGVPQGTSAKLMRFASALKVNTKHQVALATSSVAKNMAASNYGYSASQLESLVALSVGNMPESYLRNLQAELEKCDRLGNSNRDVPADEDVSTFSEIIGSAENAADIKDMVAQLVTS
ncbi:g4916 [Coccomyxa viridis]|uniref:G4916 protein n=1 Tax=Coccomyxa viridis TaxID=1274662 RepID=A0ABP1FTS2_9CHLO